MIFWGQKKRILFLLTCIYLLSLSPTSVSNAKPLSDREQIQILLTQTQNNLDYLTNLKDRTFAYEFTQDLKESRSRLDDLNREFEKLNTPLSKDGPETHQLLTRVTLLSNHVAAQREAIESDPKSTGKRTVAVTIWFGDKKVPNWRVGYLGENSVKADENVSLLVDHLCSRIESRKYYEVSSEAKAEMKIDVIVGWVYMWVQPPNNCAPRSEPQHFKNPKVVDLYPPAEKP